MFYILAHTFHIITQKHSFNRHILKPTSQCLRTYHICCGILKPFNISAQLISFASKESRCFSIKRNTFEGQLNIMNGPSDKITITNERKTERCVVVVVPNQSPAYVQNASEFLIDTLQVAICKILSKFPPVVSWSTEAVPEPVLGAGIITRYGTNTCMCTCTQNAHQIKAYIIFKPFLKKEFTVLPGNVNEHPII